MLRVLKISRGYSTTCVIAYQCGANDRLQSEVHSAANRETSIAMIHMIQEHYGKYIETMGTRYFTHITY